jgi:hypothetical protein
MSKIILKPHKLPEQAYRVYAIRHETLGYLKSYSNQKATYTQIKDQCKKFKSQEQVKQLLKQLDNNHYTVMV